MQVFVHRNVPLVLGLVFVVVFSGCSPYAVDDIIRTRSADAHQYRVDRDAGRYVVQVDRRVRLDRRQARYLERMLRERTYRLLDRTRSRNHRYVYPFPRRDYRNMNRAQRRFWYDADRLIERRLSPRQARRYAAMTGRSMARVRPYSDRVVPRRPSGERRYRRPEGEARPRGDGLSRSGGDSRHDNGARSRGDEDVRSRGAEDVRSRGDRDARSRGNQDVRSRGDRDARVSPQRGADRDGRRYRGPTEGREENRRTGRRSVDADE